MAGLVSIAREILFPNRDQHTIPVMDGNLSPNDALERCEEVAKFDDQIDDIAFDHSGAMYVSVGHTVQRASAVTPESFELFTSFTNNAGGLAMHPDGRLLVCVSGEGVAAVAKDGNISWLKEADGKPIHCATAVTAAADGSIFITEGSGQHVPEDWVLDLMEKNSSGRLIRCADDLSKAMTIRSNLAWPHGCMMSADESSVLYTESWAHTLSSCDRDGGGVKKIVANMPGYPARLSADPDGTIWLSLFAVRTHLVELVLDDKNFREEMMTKIEPRYWISPAMRATGSYLEPLQGGGVKKLGIVKAWAPPRAYGLVMRIDAQGEIQESLHSRVGGGCHGVTSVRRQGDKLYVISKGHQRLMSQFRGAGQ
jgi:sugar lactone lactonase YvrE